MTNEKNTYRFTKLDGLIRLRAGIFVQQNGLYG